VVFRFASRAAASQYSKGALRYRVVTHEEGAEFNSLLQEIHFFCQSLIYLEPSLKIKLEGPNTVVCLPREFDKF
jgi:hypothetical protein